MNFGFSFMNSVSDKLLQACYIKILCWGQYVLLVHLCLPLHSSSYHYRHRHHKHRNHHHYHPHLNTEFTSLFHVFGDSQLFVNGFRDGMTPLLHAFGASVLSFDRPGFGACCVCLHCCYSVVTLLLHYCYTVVRLLLHCCYTVATLLSYCCHTVHTLLAPLLVCIVYLRCCVYQYALLHVYTYAPPPYRLSSSLPLYQPVWSCVCLSALRIAHCISLQV
jgi:hypothetical protein